MKFIRINLKEEQTDSETVNKKTLIIDKDKIEWILYDRDARVKKDLFQEDWQRVQIFLSNRQAGKRVGVGNI